MRRLVTGVICLSVLFAPGMSGALELVTNGEFEVDLSQGWQQSTAGSGVTVTRGVAYDPDPDYEVFLSKITGTGHAKIWQRFVLPSTDLHFAANVKAYATASGGAWCASALLLRYMDQYGAQLGQTAIGARSADCPWTESPTCHIIDVVPNSWSHYSFDLNDELANLPGVDPGQVRKLEVEVVVTAADC